jgi:hypothetical protein
MRRQLTYVMELSVALHTMSQGRSSREVRGSGRNSSLPSSSSPYSTLYHRSPPTSFGFGFLSLAELW